MLSVFDLPNEIVLTILDYIPLQTLGRLTLTCRTLHDRLNSLLYWKGQEGDTTALDWAATTGNQKTVQRIFQYTSPSPNFIERAINSAIPKNHVPTVRLLLDQGLPPWDPASSTEGAFSSPLFRAGMCRNLEIVKMLLDAGAKPIGYSNEEVGFLVHGCTSWENGPDSEETSQQHDEPFDPSILQLLVQRGLRVNSPEIVHHALALGCRVGVMSFLIDLGLDPNVQSFNWHTPLYQVLGRREKDWKECVAFIQKCVEHGMDVNLRDAQGMTILDKVGENAHPAVVQELITAGGKVPAIDMYSIRMQYAAMRKDASLNSAPPFRCPRGYTWNRRG
jgi:hypothetical protein